MEPGLRGREDPCIRVGPRWLAWQPLWSPAFGAGKTTGRGVQGRAGRAGRYGARPSGPGRPGSRSSHHRRSMRAAMEPGLRGREDSSLSCSGIRDTSPLWSPAFGAGKTEVALLHPRRADDAAMEPGLRGREDTVQALVERAGGHEPLWSPAFGAGKTSSAPEAMLRSLSPLWSPAFGAGKTRVSHGPAASQEVPLWSPAFGAGKTRRATATRPGPEGRYGARPSGPGRRSAPPRTRCPC